MRRAWCCVLLLTCAIPAQAAGVDVGNCEIFMEGRDALITGNMQDRRVLMAFSRRDGKSFRGMAWLPLKRGKFPRPVMIDTSGVEFRGGKIAGSFDLELKGVVPRHTFVYEGRYEDDVVYGAWRIKSGDKEAVGTIKGSLYVRNIARDAPFTDPNAMNTTEPWGEILDTPHPFMWWTKEEAAALRKRIETDPDAKKQYELMQSRMSGAGGILNLFKYLVMGDKAAGEAEKRYLLGFRGSHPMRFYTGIGGGRHFDNYLLALRYDVLYDLLSVEERKALEDTFRSFIKHHIHEDYKREYTRTNWLPNMQWPRPMAAHLMAVALRDRKAIELMFHSVGGWKWYMDSYVADGRFYMEEFGKQYSMIGEMFLWCRGLKRLGLNDMGYGYTGAGGGCMRNYIESLYDIALPRVDNPGGTPSYRHIHMGDAGASCLVAGIKNGATLSRHYGKYFRGANMNGRDYTRRIVPKMMTPLWFEAADEEWPDGGFDYALAHWRLPGDEEHYPTLLFGRKPLSPKSVKPPPARSFAARERGFAMLRAEGGPEYWTSPRPAVALQFGMYYVHYVHDCFSLLEYYAFNRPIYSKLAFGPHRGYAGGHPWRDSVRGQVSGVTVDNMQIQPVDNGDNGCAHQQIRDGFTDAVKFVAVRSKPYEVRTKNFETGEVSTSMKALYPGVDMERALFLTDEYLFDVFNLKSDRARLYEWSAHPVGSARLDEPAAWEPTDEFDGGVLWRGAAGLRGRASGGGFDLANVRKRDMADADWCFKTVQGDGIGVVTHFLGEGGTTACYAQTNVVTLIAQRRKPSTVFAVLHEHFRDDTQSVEEYELLARSKDGIAVRVTGDRGSGIDDRLAFAYADRAGESITLASKKESITFRDYAYVRIGRKEVIASGDITAMKVDVRGKPKLILNGAQVAAKVSWGYMRFEGGE